MKNHWSIDQWHLEVYEPRYYSGSYARTAKLFGMSKNFVLCTHATNHLKKDGIVTYKENRPLHLLILVYNNRLSPMLLYHHAQITYMAKDNINYFFNPKSIAVIGASRSPKKFGHIIFRNLLGKAYPVNPNAQEVLGKKCYRSVKEIKGAIDLAVIAVPSAAVADAVKECNEKGVKAAVIVTSGFAEIGRHDEEAKIRQLAGKMRLIGPNVIGLYDPYSGVDTVFNLRHRQQRPRKGSIAFLSQSGALGAAVMDQASYDHIGLSKFVSLGNMADVNETDMLDYLAGDNNTKTITMYIEGSKDYRKLYESLKRVTKTKPVIVVKAGKTEETKKAVASHTASLAGAADIFSGMLRQAGAIESSSDDMFDIAKAFNQPLPHGNRVQIVTDGGGFGILAADALIVNGMRLSRLSPAKEIKNYVPSYATVSNPLDLTGDATTNRYRDVLPFVFKDQGVDMVLVVLLMQISALDSKIVDVLASMKRFKKPFVVCMAGGEYTNIHRKLLEEKGIPTYSSPEKAAKALKALFDYEKYRRRSKSS